jgi:UDP-2,3-diacylglucosamine hydrolase
MPERYYFISDVHLGIRPDPANAVYKPGAKRDNEDIAREQRLLKVLNHIELEAEAGMAKGLFIVGDLFDSWFEYKSVIPRRHIRTLAKLADIAAIIPVEYLMGNHDFGHQDYFESELGIKVHSGDIERTLLGKKFLIAHGDGKALNDTGYLILRKILRNEALLTIYSWLHPDIGIRLAESVSKGSRGYTDQRDALQKQDGLRIFAEKAIREQHFDYVIMGHRHLPQLTDITSDDRTLLGRYVNLGDWIKSYTYGVFDEEGFRIVEAG